jgi:hypothetical protein
MKTFMIILFSIVLGNRTTSFADDDKYLEAMAKNIQTVYTSKSIADLQIAVNMLDRIGSSEKTKWEPYYYAGFGYIMMANQEAEARKKDAYLDQAAACVSKAKAIAINESEIICLEGFIHMMRVTVDPASRGQQYSGLAMQAFGKASSLNPENPRALALEAQMQFGTARFFGSPTTDACLVLDRALQKFDNYKPENALSPQWGKEMALGLKKECK